VDKKCAVLVPSVGAIEPETQMCLNTLQKEHGYPIIPLVGCGNIDIARSVLASQALDMGFEELMWIDSDIVFRPIDVDLLRAQGEPFSCGLYIKRNGQEMACRYMDGTKEVKLGNEGGLMQVRFAGFGFTYVKKQVFDAIRIQHVLPTCTPYLGKPFVPYFMPLIVHDFGEPWYLSEDYSFCWRAAKCGFKVMADTRIRLAHLAKRALTWDELMPRQQYGGITLKVPD
jgi:hypothetical protein